MAMIMLAVVLCFAAGVRVVVCNLAILRATPALVGVMMAKVIVRGTGTLHDDRLCCPRV